jgi:hypothetical protein
LLLIAVILFASLAFILSQRLTAENKSIEDKLYFGVSYGQPTAENAKILIDRVKNFTNFFLVNSYDLVTNETALNEVCDYAAQANLKFIVYFDFISRIAYPWHQHGWTMRARVGATISWAFTSAMNRVNKLIPKYFTKPKLYRCRKSFHNLSSSTA